jgi:hypothetical protein
MELLYANGRTDGHDEENSRAYCRATEEHDSFNLSMMFISATFIDVFNLNLL